MGVVTIPERRALRACTLAWATDSFEFNLFLLLAPGVASSLGLNRGEMSVVLTIALFSSSLGGWLAGRLADRIGRVRLFRWSLIGLGVSTGLSAGAFSFESLVIARLLLGVAFGAEWTAGTVILNECVRPSQRGRFIGLLLSGWGIGWGFAALTNALVYSLFSDEIAWRTALLIGVFPVILSWFARRLLTEPTIFIATREKKTNFKHFGIWSVQHRWRTLVLCSLAVGVQGGFYALNVWLPTYLRSLGIGPVNTSLLIGYAVVGSVFGSLAGGWISDHFGRRLALGGGAAGIFISALAFTNLNSFPGILETALALAAFTASVTFSALAAVLAESFPTWIRGEGQGFTYNFGRALAGFFPLLIGIWSGFLSVNLSIVLFVGLSSLIVVLAAAFLTETRGVDLRDVDTQSEEYHGAV